MPDDVRIRVLAERRASPDGGEHFYDYVAGETYGPDTDPPMPASLAETFLREGWGERTCAKILAQVEPAPAAPPRVRVHEDPGQPAAACDWCGAPFTARSGRGGPAKRFCSDAHRAAFHRGGRRWIARELEAGRLDIADLRED